MLKSDSIPQKLLGRDIIFFDGECVLCNGFVKKLLVADQDKHFLLGAQQSKTAHDVLERHGINADDLSTMYVVTNCGTEDEKVLTRSTGVIYALSKFRSGTIFAKLLQLVPKFLRDFGYKMIASNRYRMFGKTNEVCAMPTPEDRARLID